MAIILRWRYTPQVGAGDVTSLAAIVGPRGKGIASSAWNASTGILTITYTDATTETLDLSGTFTARDAAIAAQAAAEAGQTAAETAETNAAKSETNAAASAAAAAASAASALSLVSQNGLVPLFGEILWPATDPAPQYFGDTGLRLLSGASERAIMVYLGDIPADLFEGGTIDGFMFDFTDDATMFSDTGGTTPAVAGDSVARVNDVSGNGLNSTQANAALRGKKGKAPKVVRNRLIQTENLTHVSWGKSNAGITVTDLGSGVFEIDFGASDRSIGQINLTPTDTNAYTAHVQMKGVAGETIRLSSKTNPTVEPVVKTLSADWQDFAITQSNSGSGRFLLDTFGGVTARVIQVRFPMQEAGSTATPYQRVGASDLDVTESGVESFGFLRLDQSDDVYPVTLPANFDGDILLAGGAGTWIEPAAPNAGAFNNGPSTHTGGTPGILRAVCGPATTGRFCGVELIDKTLSAEERARVIAYYKARGAKGLLVPGPELVTNGGFDTDTAWAKGQLGTGPAATIAGGVGNIARTDGTNFGHLSQTVISPAGVFLVSGNFGIGGGLVRIGNAVLNTQYFVASFSAGPFERIIVTSGANPVVTLHGATDGVGTTVDDFSMRELRPEEDW